ncbi:MAG: glycosyltransferase [Patescibacteria group bacterium]
MATVSDNYNIICLSNQLWDFPNWTNKKHVMTRLAKLGNTVLFVDPPINAGRVFFRQISRKLWPVRRLLTQTKKDEVGAVVYTPVNLLPFTDLTSKNHASRIASLAKEYFNTDRKTVLWIYHVEIPQIQNYLENVPHDFLVYDCVDDYESFPLYDTPEKKEKVRSQEKYLAEKADLVFATTPLLVEKLKKYNPNVYFTPNVGDYEKFKNSRALKKKLPKDLEVIPRPRVGFAGALDEYKFDAELMKLTAQNNPTISFVLIGQMALKDKGASLGGVGLSDLKNIYLIGSRPYEILEYYYAGFDAYIIPYRLNDYTVGGCFPVKFHDALASGLATVVTDLPAYAPFRDVCYISKNKAEFSTNVKKAVMEDNDAKIKARQVVASENNWDGKTQKLLELIGTHLKK